MSERGAGTRSPKRKLTPEQRKRILRRRRIRKYKAMLRANLKFIVPICAMLIVGIILLVSLPKTSGGDKHISEAVIGADNDWSMTDGQPEDPEPADGGVSTESEMSDLPDDEREAEADPGYGSAGNEASASSNEVSWTPAGDFVYDEAYPYAVRGEVTGPVLRSRYREVVSADKLNRWPEESTGMLPVLRTAENATENAICITVDDCFQGENLRRIVQCALDYGGKLTIFPIGKNLKLESVASSIRFAWENGMEIENHTYNHTGMFHYDDERMVNEMWAQHMMLNETLGVNYQQHFFRPKGGDERSDQRVHAYANQMGMYGIAMWTVSGSSGSKDTLLKAIRPGSCYLFHTTDNDLQRLLWLIPEAASRGFKLVTLNEMYGLPENETSELTQTMKTATPKLEAFKIEIPSLKATTRMRAAAIVQMRLIELGWLSDKGSGEYAAADGEYGKKSAKAVAAFQKASGLKGDGIAGAETQKLLFSNSAAVSG